jgi:hypothetical protein
VAAVASARVRWVADAANAALAHDDAWAGFTGLLLQMAERHAGDLIHGTALAEAGGSPELDEARAAAHDALAALMERAQAQGAMRPDATVEDVRVLFRGVTAEMDPASRHDRAAWRRWAAMFAGAFRAGGA